MKILSKTRKTGSFAVFCRVFVIICMATTLLITPLAAYAQPVLTMPEPGQMLPLSAAHVPALLKGMSIDTRHPLNFEFILDTGDEQFATEEALRQEADALVRYFLAVVSMPEEALWVNLSPYEQDRIMEDDLAQTLLGKDLLIQDYLLKQLSSSLLHPDKPLGKKYWQQIYERAYELYGSTEIPMDYFQKVWIMPASAEVLEEGNRAYVVDATLKVMTEKDYVATQQHHGDQHHSGAAQGQEENLSTQVIRDVILPAIEKELNEGEHFVRLRQIYHAMILATWYKQKLWNSVLLLENNNHPLVEKYFDHKNVQGIENGDPSARERIYQQYVQAFKQGVFDFIREDVDPFTQETLPRHYFSGGGEFRFLPRDLGVVARHQTDPRQLEASGNQIVIKGAYVFSDESMVVVEKRGWITNSDGLHTENIISKYARFTQDLGSPLDWRENHEYADNPYFHEFLSAFESDRPHFRDELVAFVEENIALFNPGFDFQQERSIETAFFDEITKDKEAYLWNLTTLTEETAVLKRQIENSGISLNAFTGDTRGLTKKVKEKLNHRQDDFNELLTKYINHQKLMAYIWVIFEKARYHSVQKMNNQTVRTNGGVALEDVLSNLEDTLVIEIQDWPDLHDRNPGLSRQNPGFDAMSKQIDAIGWAKLKKLKYAQQLNPEQPLMGIYQIFSTQPRVLKQLVTEVLDAVDQKETQFDHVLSDENNADAAVEKVKQELEDAYQLETWLYHVLSLWSDPAKQEAQEEAVEASPADVDDVFPTIEEDGDRADDGEGIADADVNVPAQSVGVVRAQATITDILGRTQQAPRREMPEQKQTLLNQGLPASLVDFLIDQYQALADSNGSINNHLFTSGSTSRFTFGGKKFAFNSVRGITGKFYLIRDAHAESDFEIIKMVAGDNRHDQLFLFKKRNQDTIYVWNTALGKVSEYYTEKEEVSSKDLNQNNEWRTFFEMITEKEITLERPSTEATRLDADVVRIINSIKNKFKGGNIEYTSFDYTQNKFASFFSKNSINRLIVTAQITDTLRLDVSAEQSIDEHDTRYVVLRNPHAHEDYLLLLWSKGSFYVIGPNTDLNRVYAMYEGEFRPDSLPNVYADSINQPGLKPSNEKQVSIGRNEAFINFTKRVRKSADDQQKSKESIELGVGFGKTAPQEMIQQANTDVTASTQADTDNDTLFASGGVAVSQQEMNDITRALLQFANRSSVKKRFATKHTQKDAVYLSVGSKTIVVNNVAENTVMVVTKRYEGTLDKGGHFYSRLFYDTQKPENMIVVTTFTDQGIGMVYHVSSGTVSTTPIEYGDKRAFASQNQVRQDAALNRFVAELNGQPTEDAERTEDQPVERREFLPEPSVDRIAGNAPPEAIQQAMIQAVNDLWVAGIRTLSNIPVSKGPSLININQVAFNIGSHPSLLKQSMIMSTPSTGVPDLTENITVRYFVGRIDSGIRLAIVRAGSWLLVVSHDHQQWLNLEEGFHMTTNRHKLNIRELNEFPVFTAFRERFANQASILLNQPEGIAFEENHLNALKDYLGEHMPQRNQDKVKDLNSNYPEARIHVKSASIFLPRAYKEKIGAFTNSKIFIDQRGVIFTMRFYFDKTLPENEKQNVLVLLRAENGQLWAYHYPTETLYQYPFMGKSEKSWEYITAARRKDDVAIQHFLAQIDGADPEQMKNEFRDALQKREADQNDTREHDVSEAAPVVEQEITKEVREEVATTAIVEEPFDFSGVPENIPGLMRGLDNINFDPQDVELEAFASKSGVFTQLGLYISFTRNTDIMLVSNKINKRKSNEDFLIRYFVIKDRPHVRLQMTIWGDLIRFVSSNGKAVWVNKSDLPVGKLGNPSINKTTTRIELVADFLHVLSEVGRAVSSNKEINPYDDWDPTIVASDPVETIGQADAVPPVVELVTPVASTETVVPAATSVVEDGRASDTEVVVPPATVETRSTEASGIDARYDVLGKVAQFVVAKSGTEFGVQDVFRGEGGVSLGDKSRVQQVFRFLQSNGIIKAGVLTKFSVVGLPDARELGLDSSERNNAFNTLLGHLNSWLAVRHQAQDTSVFDGFDLMDIVSEEESALLDILDQVLMVALKMKMIQPSVDNEGQYTVGEFYDSAMNVSSDLGGIDLRNPEWDFAITTQEGYAPIRFEFDPVELQRIQNNPLKQLTPKFYEFIPVNSVLPLFGFHDEESQEQSPELVFNLFTVFDRVKSVC